jgi:periplasmic copper chaperone A
MLIRRYIVGWAALALSLCAATPLLAAAAAPLPATIAISQAWIRANAPGLDVAAAYFNVRNSGKQPVVLSGISTPVAASATMHMTVISKGISSMRELDGLTIAAGETVKFEPGGMHVMLMGLKAPLQPGRSAALQFRFGNGAVLQIVARIKPLAGP